MRAARVLTVGGGLLAAVAGRSRALTALSGLALTAGSLCTRFGILEAGRASAADPKYTVVPQRDRLDAQSSPDHGSAAGAGAAGELTVQFGPCPVGSASSSGCVLSGQRAARSA